MSPGSSSGSTAPRPLGWPPRPRPPARLAAEQSDEVLALGRRLFWDPVGPLPLYPHLGKGIGKLFVRVSWSEEIDDPNEPARILNRLESTAIGCAWLLDRWGELRQRLETGGNWQPPERLKAIRLLGRQPMDAPQDDRVMMIYLACWAMDLNGPHGFADLVNELQPAELKLWIDRLDDRRAMSRRPASPEAGEEEVLKIIAAEEERLEEVLELHLERDETAGLEPLLFDDSDSGERLRRYQLACNRTLLRILDTLERRQRARGKARAEPAAAAAADRLADIGPPPAAASTPQDIAGAPVQDDCMPAIDEPAVLDDEPAVLDDEPAVLDDEPAVLDDEPAVLDDEPADASSSPSVGPADECPAPAEIAAPVEPAGAATGAKLPAFPGETATEGRNSQNEPNEPAGAAGGRALDGLAALLALLKLAVVVLFAATAAVKGAWAMALESPFRKARLAVVGWAQPGTAPILSGFAPQPDRYQPDAPAKVGPSGPRTRSDTSPTRQRGSARPDPAPGPIPARRASEGRPVVTRQ